MSALTNHIDNPPAPPADAQEAAPSSTSATSSSYTPPEVQPGALVGFPRTSNAGQEYMNLFYMDENNVMHRLNVFKNVSKNSGKTYFRGYGDKFATEQEAPAPSLEDTVLV